MRNGSIAIKMNHRNEMMKAVKTKSSVEQQKARTYINIYAPTYMDIMLRIHRLRLKGIRMSEQARRKIKSLLYLTPHIPHIKTSFSLDSNVKKKQTHIKIK